MAFFSRIRQLKFVTLKQRFTVHWIPYILWQVISANLLPFIDTLCRLLICYWSLFMSSDTIYSFTSWFSKERVTIIEYRLYNNIGKFTRDKLCVMHSHPLSCPYFGQTLSHIIHSSRFKNWRRLCPSSILLACQYWQTWKVSYNVYVFKLKSFKMTTFLLINKHTKYHVKRYFLKHCLAPREISVGILQDVMVAVVLS